MRMDILQFAKLRPSAGINEPFCQENVKSGDDVYQLTWLTDWTGVFLCRCAKKLFPTFSLIMNELGRKNIPKISHFLPNGRMAG
ncbi:MAG: hypothetical protein BGO69_10075 [Bacteroidetes bacterium 46-16]|nr:MAG: hypothetical protein BGO69_10075 [Bacteroidetes bacterium 46-16]